MQGTTGTKHSCSGLKDIYINTRAARTGDYRTGCLLLGLLLFAAVIVYDCYN
jgi:hypothetical protein